MAQKIKSIIVSVNIIALISISYGLGYLELENERSSRIFIVEDVFSMETTAITDTIITDTIEKENKSDIVGSINGTKYYFVWCSGVSRINKENLRYFSSTEEAEKEGYELAKNCN